MRIFSTGERQIIAIIILEVFGNLFSLHYFNHDNILKKLKIIFNILQ